MSDISYVVIELFTVPEDCVIFKTALLGMIEIFKKTKKPEMKLKAGKSGPQDIRKHQGYGPF